MEIIKTKPDFIYLTVNTTTPRSGFPIIRHFNDWFHRATNDFLATGLVVQTNKNKYRFIDLNIRLSFYEDQYFAKKYAAPFYGFLYTIVDHIMVPYYIQIPIYRDAKQLFAGEVYPSKIMRKYYQHHGLLSELVLRDHSNKRHKSWIEKNRQVFEEMGLME